MIKRICLLAGYDRDGLIHDYVIYLIESLSRFSKVYYFCDNDLAPGERDKLTGLATICGARRHGRYDFGSWAEMIDTIGWDTIIQFDELILTNDSCYGPFHNLDDICEQMSRRDCDFWGMTGSREILTHIQSYFVIFKKSIIRDSCFQKFWKNIEIKEFYEDVVEAYEVGLSTLLLENKFSPSTYLSSSLHENLTTFPLTTVRDFGMPFVKVKCFRDPYIGSRERISLLFRYLRKADRRVAAMIARHQGAGFLARGMLAQKQENPVYFNYGFIRARAIRDNRLKIVLFNRWRVIVSLTPRQMRRLARLPFLHVRI